MTGKFPHLVKKWTPRSMFPKSTPRHMKSNSKKTKAKKNFKSSKKKKKGYIQGNIIRLISRFFNKKFQAKKKWNDIFKI